LVAFENLLPGDVSVGSWDTGISIASAECLTYDFLYFGRLDLLYQGAPGDVMILDHPMYARWVTDCERPARLNFYCVWMHGGIGKDPIPGDPGCVPPGHSPVEDVTWSSIKAIYR
jgi:hypothetical protein